MRYYFAIAHLRGNTALQCWAERARLRVCRICRLPFAALPFAALPFARLQHAFAVCAFAARTFAAFHVAFKFRCMESKEEDMIAARRCNSTTWSTEH